MMHYNPWIHQQQMLLEQHPYYPYAYNDLQTYYSSSDHQDEDNDYTGDEIPSETSSNQSPNADSFRLAFEASQWSKLVLNAEGLFNKLVTTNAISPNEQSLLKNQIEQWLCMKQEYEECIARDDSGSLQGFTTNTRRSLEKIEEVTETDEKTDESNNWNKLKSRSCSGSESEAFDDEDQSGTESENPDFFDKLDEYIQKFKDETDEIIDTKKNDSFKLKDISPVTIPYINSFVPIVKPIPIKYSASRRKSILPNSEMSNDIAEFQKQNRSINVHEKDHYSLKSSPVFNSTKKNDNQAKSNNDFEEETMKSIIKAQSAIINPEHISKLKMLNINNEEKQSRMKKIQFDLNLAYKQVEELQNAIKVKEQFIEDMLQSSDVRNSAKQKFQKRRSKFEEKYRNTEKLLKYKRVHRDIEDEFTYNEEIEKYENLLRYYEKKLKDTKTIKQVADNSAKTVVYLKNSLSASKKQMEELKQRIKVEEEHKKSLEGELINNKKRMKELEEKYNLTSSRLKEKLSESQDEENHCGLKMKRDNTNLREASEKVSRLDQLLKGKLDTERIDENDEKKTLREEIRNLRHIRDGLIDMKCKYTSEATLITDEKQRQFLLISEYVETIDALIEQKNVMICRKSNFDENKSNRLNEQMPIINLLEKLPHDELVTLFNKYFDKVIDLKDSSKSLEMQNAILEESLKIQQTEHDTRILMLQKSYERKISLLLNYYAEETSSSSYDNKLDRSNDFESLIKENQALRERLVHFDSLLQTSETSQADRCASIKRTKKDMKPELMSMELPPKTTKVTRKGNKLIFQTSTKEK